MVKIQPTLDDQDLQVIMAAPVKGHQSQNFRINTLILFLWESGCRISEALGLVVKDVDLIKSLVVFRDTKNGDDRLIPINRELADRINTLIEKRQPGDYVFSLKGSKPMSRASAYNAITRRVKLAGLDKKIGCHSFRHHFITDKLNKGVSVFKVMKFVGHKAITSTQRYYHGTTADLIDVLNA